MPLDKPKVVKLKAIAKITLKCYRLQGYSLDQKCLRGSMRFTLLWKIMENTHWSQSQQSDIGLCVYFCILGKWPDLIQLLLVPLSCELLVINDNTTGKWKLPSASPTISVCPKLYNLYITHIKDWTLTFLCVVPDVCLISDFFFPSRRSNQYNLTDV